MIEHPLMYNHRAISTMGAVATTTVDVNSTAYKNGLTLITYYHNESRKYPTYKFATVKDLINSYGAVKGPLIVKGIGDVYRISEMTWQSALDSMKRLATAGKGRIPLSYAYGEALRTGRLVDDYFSIAESVVDDLAKAAVTGGKAVYDVTGKAISATGQALSATGSALAKPFVAVGETVSGTFSSLSMALKVLPWAALVVGGVIVYQRLGGKFGRQ